MSGTQRFYEVFKSSLFVIQRHAFMNKSTVKKQTNKQTKYILFFCQKAHHGFSEYESIILSCVRRGHLQNWSCSG